MTAQDEEKLIERFTQCVTSAEPFENEEQKAVCQKMVDNLPKLEPEKVDTERDLKDIAACTSYAYWYLSQKPDTRPAPEIQNAMALREARRHLAYMTNDYDKALASFIQCLTYRKENNLDVLKTCFNSPPAQKPEEAETATDPADTNGDCNGVSNGEKKEETEEEYSKRIGNLILEDLTHQKVIMRARDREHRGVMIKYARLSTGTTEDSYIWSQVYMAERSVAVAEYGTLGKHERTVSIFDYHGFESSKAPAVSTQIKTANLLQNLYPERLQSLLFLEPPFWLRGVLAVLKPVISAEILDRIEMATGTEETSKMVSELVDADQKALLLTPEEQLNTAISLEHFLFDVPFYALYDDVKCEREIPEPRAAEETGEGDGSLASLAGSATSFMKSLW
mmetsp:Transcript_18609/g.51747  ORF Transcript_18609/g.51747 Transcript_18609/m.51747 type:complete len:394 (-) Transcript_18609:1031-2212(-)|eukprot:CAMPEP_0198135320 /NCGR_PEP_ID=MMETSP1442-20131203/60529_1 /TAXON_ID= /ORGANISM="Craspedostauros australis, Strain CCMP3328" /LENGTH=393 /DNA_ID=CAMNT_0043796485 /DNA_START=629 /DNA_END=1810 /DNA_ORIENTATION=-